jgi:hypothetical protein
VAKRPVFLPKLDDHNTVLSKEVEFTWSPGFAPSQKAKSRDSLHAAAAAMGISPILEVSSKSDSALGKSLSAFVLKVPTPVGEIACLESVFQGSKVFNGFGPCHDLYDFDPREAKRLGRERDHGDLVQFDFFGDPWPLEPKTAFYDWLFLLAISKQPKDVLLEVSIYNGFTDIEFNPARSFNCQARSCALAVALFREGNFESAVRSKFDYLNSIDRFSPTRSKDDSSLHKQAELF